MDGCASCIYLTNSCFFFSFCWLAKSINCFTFSLRDSFLGLVDCVRSPCLLVLMSWLFKKLPISDFSSCDLICDFVDFLSAWVSCEWVFSFSPWLLEEKSFFCFSIKLVTGAASLLSINCFTFSWTFSSSLLEERWWSFFSIKLTGGESWGIWVESFSFLFSVGAFGKVFPLSSIELFDFEAILAGILLAKFCALICSFPWSADKGCSPCSFKSVSGFECLVSATFILRSSVTFSINLSFNSSFVLCCSSLSDFSVCEEAFCCCFGWLSLIAEASWTITIKKAIKYRFFIRIILTKLFCLNIKIYVYIRFYFHFNRLLW